MAGSEPADGAGRRGQAGVKVQAAALGKVFLVGAFLIAALFILSRFVDLQQLRAAELVRAQREGDSFVAVLNAYVKKTAESLNLVFMNLDEETRFDGGVGARTDRWTDLFGATVAANEELLDLYATDSNGTIRQSTDKSLIGKAVVDGTIIDRARNSREVVFGKPMSCSDCPSPFVFQVARRLTDRDGQYVGVLVGRVNPQTLQGFAGTLGDRFVGTARVIMRDGTVLVAEPPLGVAVGSAISTDVVDRWALDERGAVAETRRVGGGEYLISHVYLKQYDLFVAFYRDKATVLADWWRSVVVSIVGSALTLLAFIAGSSIYFFLLSQRDTEQRKASLRASELDIVQRAARLTGLRWYPMTNSLVSQPGAEDVLGDAAAVGLASGNLPDLLRIFPDETALRILDVVRDCFETGSEHRVEAALRQTPGRPRQAHLALTTFRGGAPGGTGVEAPHVFIVCQENTEWQEMRMQHAHLMRMDSVGQITGGVAHDFNNLLVLILGNLEDVADYVADDDPMHGLVDATMGAAIQARELTTRLLAFARKQPLEPTNVDIRALVEGMGTLLKRTIGEHVSLGFDAVVGEDLWRALIDRTQLETALINLVINARDALRDGGGSITIRVKNRRVTFEDAGGADGLAPGDYVDVMVEDNGKGMGEEERERSVEPYFTTKAPGEGAGLGLSQVYGFVNQSGGHFRIYSQEGAGTVVHMYLPRAGQVVQGAVVAAAEAEDIPFGNETILVVEDDGSVRQHVERVLTGMGYKVISRLDGRAAIRLVQEGAEFDLLLTDVRMPGGMDGIQLAREVRSMKPGVPVLFMSGYAKDMIPGPGGSAALPDGTDLHFLQKPFLRAEIARKVAEALGHPDG